MRSSRLHVSELMMTSRSHPVHARLHQGFHWQVPTAFNIAWACCGRWARNPRTAGRTAITWEHEDGAQGELSFAQMQAQADRLAHALVRNGVQRGDRVAIVLPQRAETAVVHMAVYMVGAVAMPLSMLFGVDALGYRLQDSGARVAFVDAVALDKLREARQPCEGLCWLVAVGEPPAQSERMASHAAAAGEASWADWLALSGDTAFPACATTADDAALLIYTSGTTGPPKGALIPHRALIGNLSGFVCSQNWFGSGRDEVLWSPADWAWTGGLMDALLPTLYFGRRIIAWNGRFSPDKAFELLERHRVTHSFLFPTALKAMMKARPEPLRHHRLRLRAIMSAGESVGGTVFDWCQRGLGLTVNEMFGQTEINYLVGNCGRYVGQDGKARAGWPAHSGSMGCAYPGHRVMVIDEVGQPCAPGQAGDVAVHRRDVHGHLDPVFFLGYWGNDAATHAKYTGEPHNSWCRTGDMAVMDDAGHLWYQGRSDDMFKAAGYRIGPSEVENCLVQHPAVANAAVVPKPDAQRGAVVKAYVVLTPELEAQRQVWSLAGQNADVQRAGHAWRQALTEDIQAHVRSRLAAYEAPKDIEFIDALPMTTTGKVQRRVLRLQEEERARHGDSAT